MAERIVEGDDGGLQVAGEAAPEADADSAGEQDWERAAADSDRVDGMEGEAPTG